MLYVNAAAAGRSDGSSWADAYRDLQGALNDARGAGDVDAEIWIAAGTYKPDCGTGDPTMAFELFGSVALYGGFAGWEECREERDPSVNISALSGDLNGDDNWPAAPLSDCCEPPLSLGTCSDTECYSAVVGLDVSCEERWRQQCSELAFRVCCDACRPSRCDNSFNVVRATEPGSRPSLDGLTIVGGEAYDPQDVYGHAGGLYSRSSSPRVTGCSFVRNRGLPGSGFFADGRPSLAKTTFIENGGFFFGDQAVEITSNESITLEELTLLNNLGSYGLRISGGAATVVDSTFRGNAGGGLFCFASECMLVRCKFVGNAGKGTFSTETVSVLDSLFLNNFDTALYTYGGALVINTVFAGNTAYSSAGVSGGSAYILNSVFYRNGDGAVSTSYGGVTIRNSILWKNYDELGDIYELSQFYSLGPVSVSHSIVDGWTGSWGGVGNSGVDPQFVDADGADNIAGTEDDDLRLSPASPAINAGDPDTSYLPATDLDGHTRVLCGRVDMGAYESGIGDYNCDQTVDLADFASWASCVTGPPEWSVASGEWPEPNDPSPESRVPNPACAAFDFNGDGDVDLDDFRAFQDTFAAP